MPFISSIWSWPYQEHVHDETRSLICYVASGNVKRWCVHQTSFFITHFLESPTYNGLWFKTCCILDKQEHEEQTHWSVIGSCEILHKFMEKYNFKLRRFNYLEILPEKQKKIIRMRFKRFQIKVLCMHC